MTVQITGGGAALARPAPEPGHPLYLCPADGAGAPGAERQCVACWCRDTLPLIARRIQSYSSRAGATTPYILLGSRLLAGEARTCRSFSQSPSRCARATLDGLEPSPDHELPKTRWLCAPRGHLVFPGLNQFLNIEMAERSGGPAARRDPRPGRLTVPGPVNRAREKPSEQRKLCRVCGRIEALFGAWRRGLQAAPKADNQEALAAGGGPGSVHSTCRDLVHTGRFRSRCRWTSSQPSPRSQRRVGQRFESKSPPVLRPSARR